MASIVLNSYHLYTLNNLHRQENQGNMRCITEKQSTKHILQSMKHAIYVPLKRGRRWDSQSRPCGRMSGTWMAGDLQRGWAPLKRAAGSQVSSVAWGRRRTRGNCLHWYRSPLYRLEQRDNSHWATDPNPLVWQTVTCSINLLSLLPVLECRIIEWW